MIRPASRATLIAMLLLGALGACGGDGDGTEGEAVDAAGALVGLFRITQGTCEGSTPKGSTFRMVQSGGSIEDGPYVPNGDSACADKTVTLLAPGTDGGLKTGQFQPMPDPAFDATGNGTAAAIVKPAKWFAVDFAIATNERDPQTGTSAAAPALRADGTRLSGDLAGLAASWNGQHFNQGAPKPGGEKPGATRVPSGTYDPETKAFTVEWASQIVGGPFNGFTGVWRLEGVFEPA